MTHETHALTIERILVALDTSTDSISALEAAAKLASVLRAELVGLFVEDINLLHLAMLPFTYEIERATGVPRHIDRDSMERDLQLQASQARRVLARAATRAELRWSFQVVRGEVKSEILKAALEADLLTLGRVSRSHLSRPALGSTARAVIESGPGFVILGGPSKAVDQPMMVTFDGSRAGSLALVAAAKLAAMGETDLVVVLIRNDPADTAEPITDLAKQCEAILHEQSYHKEPDFRRISSQQTMSLIKIAVDTDCSLLVLGGDSPLLQGAALQEMLDALKCPVMLVR
jgi:nucleotide-binding universal stress UspA family protein